MEYTVPDFVGDPIVAWRCWFVVPEDKTSGALRLQSIVYGDLWEPREAHKASCRPGAPKPPQGTPPHDPPGDGHGCGIYAVSTPEQVDKYYRNGDYHARQQWMEIWRVIGTVAMWGKIVPGSKGYRAEYAYPTKIQVPKVIKNGQEPHLSAKEVVVSLEHYGCEVELVDDTIELKPTLWGSI